MPFRMKHTESDDLEEVHEINVTPFIDVMLVLLIIFMVAAPLATVDVPVDLPSAASQPVPKPDKPIFLTMRMDRTLVLGNATVTPDTLSVALDKASGSDRSQRIFLRADKAVAYGDLMATMNALRAAGYLKIALVALESAAAP
jgi:biopolymer transport protein ExbD